MSADHTWGSTTRAAGVLAGQLAQVHADLVDLLEELVDTDGWAGDGVRSPEHWAQVYLAASSAQASALVRVARRTTSAPILVERMRAGRLSLDQADLIARHVPDANLHEVAHYAEHVTVTQLRRTLGRYAFDDLGQDLETAPSTDRPPRPALTMSTRRGRFHLSLETDAIQGELVEQAIREAKDALFTAGNEHATLADGVVEMASRSLAAVGTPDRAARYRVLIHLDTEGNGWLGKKGALPPHLVQQFTCDGTVRPVWESDGSPVSVGRGKRIVPARTRALVEDRDGGCRYPGCPVTGFLDNHHIVHWSKGGQTNIDSVVSLCPYHHTEHHRGSFDIVGNATDGHNADVPHSARQPHQAGAPRGRCASDSSTAPVESGPRASVQP